MGHNATPLVQVHIEESKDREARWLNKGKKFYYDYKKHVITNKACFINGVITAPANVSDMSVFPDLVDEVKPEKNIRVYADKDYAYQKNRELLKEKKLKDRIMHNKPPKKELDDK